jgi:hypothetical protein
MSHGRSCTIPSVFIPDRAIVPLVLIYHVWRIERAIYGPCWRTIFRRSIFCKFQDFIIISVLYRCSIIFSTNDPHRCPCKPQIFVFHRTIQQGTGLLMTFTKHVGKTLEKFTVELFWVKMTPWFLKMTPCFEVNGATGPFLKFSGMNAFPWRVMWKQPLHIKPINL